MPQLSSITCVFTLLSWTTRSLPFCIKSVDPQVTGINLGTTNVEISNKNAALSLRFAAIGDWGLDTNRSDIYVD